MLSENDLTILGRTALAAVLGLVIGWERQATGSAIKARTIALAALTAASLTALGHEIFATGTDRIVQGIVLKSLLGGEGRGGEDKKKRGDEAGAEPCEHCFLRGTRSRQTGARALS